MNSYLKLKSLEMTGFIIKEGCLYAVLKGTVRRNTAV